MRILTRRINTNPPPLTWDSYILRENCQENPEALFSKTTVCSKVEPQNRHCELPKIQALVNSAVLMEMEYIWPIKKAIVLSWNITSNNGFFGAEALLNDRCLFFPLRR